MTVGSPAEGTGRPGIGASFRATRALLGSEARGFALATLADQGTRLGLNLVAAGVLGPVPFGTWVLLSALIQYSTFATLGVVNGAAREIPRSLGAGDPAGARHIEDVATGAALLAGVVTAAAAALIGPALVGGGIAGGLLGLAVLGQGLVALQQILFRANLRFDAAAEQLALGAVATPMLGVPALRFGVDGLLAARAVVQAAVVARAVRRFGRIPRPALDSGTLRHLIHVGAPVMLAGLVFALLITIDRWLVEALLGREAVGRYGLVTVAIGGLLVVPTWVGQQLYPRLSHERGAGSGGGRLLEVAVRTGVAAGVATAGLGLVATIGAWILVPVALPEYASALVPLAIGCAAVAVYAAASALGYVLNLTGRQLQLAGAQAVALGVDVALSLVLVEAGLGLAAFPTALLVTFTGYALGMTVLARRAARADEVSRAEAARPADASGPEGPA